MRFLTIGSSVLSMSFRSWDLYEYLLLQNTKHSLSRLLSWKNLDMFSLLCNELARNVQDYINYNIAKKISSPFFNTKDKNQDFLIEHNLKKSFIMTIPTFVDLQGFIVVVKKVTALRKGVIFSHYIFTCPMS